MTNSTKTNRIYQYRLYPTKAQAAQLDEIVFLARLLYNRMLEYKIKCWQESRRSVSAYDLMSLWSDWRNEDRDENPLRLLNMTAGKNVIQRLDKAYAAFFRRGNGFPKFQNRFRFTSVDYTYNNGTRLVDGYAAPRLYVQNVGNIKMKWHRDLPPYAKIKQVNIKRKASGWYASLVLELPFTEPLPSDKPLVGIDMGLMRLLTLSDGSTIDNPRWLKSSLAKLRVAQRKLSRRKKGSKGRKEAAHQVALLHEQIANTRRDFWHKVTTWLVGTYGAIAIEDLKLGFMTRNEHLSQSAHDAGLGMFTEMLKSKAQAAGVPVIAVNPRNTSQACSGCGCIVEKDLKTRVHDCPHCGLVIDRDENAARNIYRLAFQVGPDRAAKRKRDAIA